MFELDPSTTGVPWQPRGYVSKRKTTDSLQIEVKPKKICTPLLENEVHKIILVIDYIEDVVLTDKIQSSRLTFVVASAC